ncbi:MAG: hypothetical protein H5T78_21050 [Nocardia sp.]|nr:hypothetical protein [Nocardia sp.]
MRSRRAPADLPDPHLSAADTDDHAAILAVAPSEHATQDSPAGAPSAATHALAVAAPSDPHTGCASAGCAEHTAIHACVFVLAALVAFSTLVLLYRLGDTVETARRVSRTWRGRRTRPPLWTVLTFSQLAILRI